MPELRNQETESAREGPLLRVSLQYSRDVTCDRLTISRQEAVVNFLSVERF